MVPGGEWEWEELTRSALPDALGVSRDLIGGRHPVSPVLVGLRFIDDRDLIVPSP
jgi:hypothetical protein